MHRDATLAEPEQHTPLRVAYALMRDALVLLDLHSYSAAAADLDLAIHRLERELGISAAND